MRWGYAVLLALALSCVAQAQAQVPALEQRLRLLTRELSLTAGQQESVRHILEGQQAAVRALLDDPRVSPAERAPAIGAIQERTANEIRAVLNDEQKDEYYKPRPASGAERHPDIETWLDVAHGKRAPPGMEEELRK
jgi:hypothetical protein